MDLDRRAARRRPAAHRRGPRPLRGLPVRPLTGARRCRQDRLAAALAALEAHASPKVRADMGPRYGIVTDRALGVPMAKMQAVAKPLGRDHALAAALWDTGVYEARMVACMVDDPAAGDAGADGPLARRLRQLGDRRHRLLQALRPGAARLRQGRRNGPALNDEFGRRAAFALLASLALHGRGTDADFLARLPLIEAAATDERNFVKKGVSWALRAIGGKKSPALRAGRPRPRRPARRSRRTRPPAGSARTRSRPSPRPTAR